MSWEAIGLATTIGGGVLGAGGQISGGMQQQQIADYNAKVAKAEGEAAQQSAGYEADQYADRAKRLISTQRANAAASGLGLEGSPLDVMDETAAQAAYDELLIRHSGSVAAAKSNSEAALDRLQGGAAASRGIYGSGATFLTGASDLAQIYGKKK
jgi:hypothetical protein